VQSTWDVEDFALSLGLSNLRVDGRRDITNSEVADSEVSKVFGKVGSG
jgi:hypothetical protein